MKKPYKKSSKRSEPRRFPTKVTTLILAVFAFWIAYRIIFRLPEWLDEIFVKALVFGLPAWWYIRKYETLDSVGLRWSVFMPGLYVGLAIGGMFGFAGVIASLARGASIEPVDLFQTGAFWQTFFVSTFTAWWETLFFFGFLQNMLKRATKFAPVVVTLIVAFLFLAFHAPLRFVQFGVTAQAARILLLLFVFALGQAFVYLRTRNLYTLTLSHLFWGMVIILYSVTS